MPELKPCTFCGANANEPVNTSSGRPIWEIGCSRYCFVMKRATRKQVIEGWNKRDESLLTAEMKNRCCGNCLYMDTIFEITGERQCEITKRSADRESDPCEHWQSCRG